MSVEQRITVLSEWRGGWQDGLVKFTSAGVFGIKTQRIIYKRPGNNVLFMSFPPRFETKEETHVCLDLWGHRNQFNLPPSKK